MEKFFIPQNIESTEILCIGFKCREDHKNCDRCILYSDYNFNNFIKQQANKKKDNKMILSEEQMKEFKELSKPVIEFLNKNTDPHHTAIITTDHAELLAGCFGFTTDEFIPDWLNEKAKT